MRGENISAKPKPADGSGPSPHAWGKRFDGEAERFGARTIPTCVGKTRWPRDCRREAADHPHMRGENSGGDGAGEGQDGPSPHAWGKLENFAQCRHHRRTIPTCVGKTPGMLTTYSPSTDHPHMRGENSTLPVGRCTFSGPSPHAWGKRLENYEHRTIQRTIPTCVGKTCQPLHSTAPAPDHPHMRGENSWEACKGNQHPGPSPHAWGKLSFQALKNTARRTIPTCVGKTRCTRHIPIPSPDHPHMRGENVRQIMFASPGNGPSPHAWGKHQFIK